MHSMLFVTESILYCMGYYVSRLARASNGLDCEGSGTQKETRMKTKHGSGRWISGGRYVSNGEVASLNTNSGLQIPIL